MNNVGSESLISIREDNSVVINADISGLENEIKKAVKHFEQLQNAASNTVSQISNFSSTASNASSGINELNTSLKNHLKEASKADAISELIKKYELLKSKTSLSAAEQNELASAIKQISKQIPQAASGFDSLGNAIGIKADTAKNAVKQMKELNNAALAKNLEKLSDKLYAAQRTTKNSDREGTSLVQYNSAQQKQLEIYNSLYPLVLRQKNLNSEMASSLYKIAARAGIATSGLQDFMKALNTDSAVLSYMDRLGDAAKKLKGEYLAKLKNAIKDEFKKRDSDPVGEYLPDSEKLKKLAEKLLSKQNASIRSVNHGLNGKSSRVQNEIEALQKMIDKLGDIHKLEVEIKVRDELEPWFEKLGIKDRKIRLQIQAMLEENDLQGAYNALQKHTKNASKKKLITQDVTQNLGLKLSKIREEYNKKSDKEYTNAISDYLSAYERKKIEIENKYRNVILNTEAQYQTAVEAGNEKQAKRLYERLEKLDEIKKMEDGIAKTQIFKDTVENIKTAFDATVTGIKSMSTGSFKGITSGVGSISGGIGGFLEKTGVSKAGVIGGAVSTVAGLVGGIGDLFSSEAETAQEKWQRVFDLTQAQYNYELSKEKELTTQIQKRMELYSYLEKIYGEDTEEAYESQKKLLEENIDLIVSKFSERGNIVIDGKSYDVSDITALQDAELEKLLTALSQNENKTSEVAKNAVLYQFQVLRNALANGAGQAEAYNELVRLMYTEMGAESGIYSLGQFMDSHGNSGGQGVEDINQNIQSFLAWYEYASASAENMTSELETYIDQEQELLDLEEARTDELEKQLGLQYKISDEILDQLRALGNAKINSILDEMKELELKIATNQILEGSSEATALRESIMGRLMAVTGSLGETNLTSALSVSRADLLKEYDETSYKKMAGIMEKFGFASGGFTGYGSSSDVAGFVHKNEVVLNSKQTEALARLFDVPSHDVASIIPNLPSIMSGAASSPVVNLTQQINISGTSQEIIDKVSKTIRYDTLNAIDDALRRVGGNL